MGVVLLLRFEYLIDHIALRSRSLLIVKKPLRYPNHISITFPNFIMRASSIAALSTILSLATVQAQFHIRKQLHRLHLGPTTRLLHLRSSRTHLSTASPGVTASLVQSIIGSLSSRASPRI